MGSNGSFFFLFLKNEMFFAYFSKKEKREGRRKKQDMEESARKNQKENPVYSYIRPLLSSPSAPIRSYLRHVYLISSYLISIPRCS